MPWLIVSVLIQLACAIHVIRSGRNQTWIMVIMFLPLAGAAAYFILEILPGLRGNRHVRTVHAKAVSRLDPERDLRGARDALEEVEQRMKRLDRTQRAAEADMYDWAMDQLRGLRIEAVG